MADSKFTTGDVVRPQPRPATTPSLYVAVTVLSALAEAFPKPKHRAKIMRALAHAVNRLGADGFVVRMREKEAVAQARARADAARVLELAWDELHEQGCGLHPYKRDPEPPAAIEKAIADAIYR